MDREGAKVDETGFTSGEDGQTLNKTEIHFNIYKRKNVSIFFKSIVRIEQFMFLPCLLVFQRLAK